MDEDEIKQFLNDVDRGVIGREKPRVNVVVDEGLTVPYWHKDVEDHDDDAGSRFEAYA